MRDSLLLETGGHLLLETGGWLLLEQQDSHGRDAHAVTARYGDSHAVTHPGQVGSVSVEVAS